MKSIVVRYPYERDFVITRDDSYGKDNVFDEFNAGSNHECPEFIDGKIRSFSVGDLVKVDGQWFRCEMTGWTALTEMEMWEYMLAIETKLIELRTLEGDPDLPAWFAVNDVVYKFKEAKKGGRFYTKAA